MTGLGIVFIVVGIILSARRLKLRLSRGKLTGIGGPILIILGILIITNVI